jgi:hypothetical protein
MDVIGHQDIGVNRKSIALPVVFDSLQVENPVPIVAKNPLPLITTHNNMVKCPFEFHPRLSGHVSQHNRKEVNKSILMPDPSMLTYYASPTPIAALDGSFCYSEKFRLGALQVPLLVKGLVSAQDFPVSLCVLKTATDELLRGFHILQVCGAELQLGY